VQTLARNTIELQGRRCYISLITVKDKVIHAVQNLPENASIEDAMERLFFLSKIEKGIQQADSGQTLSHAQVKERMSKWLK